MSTPPPPPNLTRPTSTFRHRPSRRTGLPSTRCPPRRRPMSSKRPAVSTKPRPKSTATPGGVVWASRPSKKQMDKTPTPQAADRRPRPPPTASAARPPTAADCHPGSWTVEARAASARVGPTPLRSRLLRLASSSGRIRSGGAIGQPPRSSAHRLWPARPASPAGWSARPPAPAHARRRRGGSPPSAPPPSAHQTACPPSRSPP